MPFRTVDCWSCDAPNTTSRMFCASCGSFIAIGSRTKAAPSALPFSGPPPVPGDADVDVSLPFVEGAMPLGSYSVEAQRRATRRTRTMTAVASIAMAMVVGGAALYLASPLGERGGVPQTAAVVSSATTPEPIDAPVPEYETTAVSGLTLEADAMSPVDLGTTTDLEPIAKPESEPVVPEPIAEPETVAPEPVVEPEPVAPDPVVPIAEPEPVAPKPVVEPEPAAPEPVVEPELVAPEPVVEPVTVAEPEVAVEAAAAPLEPAVRQVEDAPVTTAAGWVCDGAFTIEDSRVREWSLGRVSFRVRPGFERVVLHLERAGQGAGEPASVSAEAVPSTQVRSTLPGVSRPSSGKTTIGLQLDQGFAGNLAVRGYHPSGLATIKEFSVYPSGRDGRNVLISTASDGCFRVRVPAWNDASNSVRRAEIIVDIKP